MHDWYEKKYRENDSLCKLLQLSLIKKKDRENAESALAILRERSHTLSQLSAKAEANMTDDAKVNKTLDFMPDRFKFPN